MTYMTLRAQTLPGALPASEYVAERTFSNPDHIVYQLALKTGDIVADFGAGSGAYALALARVVGQSGIVYAVDIQRDLLTRIKNLAQNTGLSNVHVLWGDIEQPEGTTLKNDLVNMVIIANTLFQTEHKKTVLHEAYRVLKPNGTLVLIDWKDSFGGLGPPTSDVVHEEDASALARSAGFVYDRGIPAGAYHYGLIYKKTQ